MSKFGWDLPPGCSARDIPGNRPEDIANEQIYDNIYDALKPIRALTAQDDGLREQAIENLFKLINNAWESGYAACKSDADEAVAYAALEHVDDARLDDDATRQQENEQRIQDEQTDDSVKCCPECERPNQFGELCEQCRQHHLETRGEEHAP
jgi:hypothetical protein